MIIAFEGADATFKETNAKKLHAHLKQKMSDIHGISESVYCKSFPRYGHPASYYVMQYLHGRYGKPNPAIVADMYAYDHFDYWNKLHFTATTEIEGKSYPNIIILDRSIVSNLAYQTAAKFISECRPICGDNTIYDHDNVANFMNSLWVKMTVDMAIPKPDIIIHMDQNVKVSNTALADRSSKDILESDLQLQDIVNDVYKYVYKYIDIPNVSEIPVYNTDGIYRSQDEIFADILKAYQNYSK